jgi:isocitrate dehydrogenase kinase/phosphatase
MEGRTRKESQSFFFPNEIAERRSIMGNPPESNEKKAVRAAQAIRSAFDRYQEEFRAITLRARSRFETRDWIGGRADALERLDLYPNVIREIVDEIERLLGEETRNRAVWRSMKRAYAPWITGRDEALFAETFFNSMTRKIFATVGIDREIEFVRTDEKKTSRRPEGAPVYRRFGPKRETVDIIREILASQPFDGSAYEEMERDAARVAREIDLYLWPVIGADEEFCIDIIPFPFFRNKAAYIVGRILTNSRTMPLVLPLLNQTDGIYVDAVLLIESHVSVVFSYTRSYFHVETDRPTELIRFLRSILPKKPVAELYIALGYSKHGKTEFYRYLETYLQRVEEMFVIAPGERGKVMIVLTLPGFDYVFKLIKDRPEYPKTITRLEVMQKYRLVNRHDRVGRMVDTQEFEHLRFRRSRFPEELLEELLQVAGDIVHAGEAYVDIEHLYVERRVTPLPIYLTREKDPEAIRRTILDVGNCIKDQAAAGIFVGDLRDEFEEMMPGVEWIVSRPNDVFMDEIEHFLGIPSRGLREIFGEAHSDLFTLDFWHRMQEIQKESRIVDTFPYDRRQRLPRSERSEIRKGL